MLQRKLRQSFNLRDGEVSISLLMQLYIFIVITVLLIVKPTISALYLANLGADFLPYAYLLIAVVAVISSYIYNKAVVRFSLKNVSIFTLSFFALSFVILGLLLQNNFLNTWLLFVYYTIVGLFAVIITSQFWVLANIVFNSREAKRLFGFIGAGAIAGGIFGGYLTTLLAPHLGNKYLILIAGILILFCIPLSLKIWQLRIRKLNVYTRNQRKIKRVKYNSSFKLLKNSKHLSYLALVFGFSVLIAKLVDYQFSDFANKSFTDTNQLASFFGFWFSTFNVIALLIQLFLTNRVLQYLGVTSSLLILPLSLALGCLLFLTYPELWVLIILKGVDGSFKQSINKAAFELSIIPISSTIRNQAKSYIDVVVDSVFTGISGFLLLFVIKELKLSSSYVTVLILLFLFLWLLLIYKLREAYFDSFRQNLQQNLAVPNENYRRLSRETTIEAATRIIEQGDEYEVLKLLKRIDSFKVDALKQNLIALLDHPSDRVKIRAIRQLYSFKEPVPFLKMETLLRTENALLADAVIDYMLDFHNLLDSGDFLKYLNHEHQIISTAALRCLAEVSKDNAKIAEKYNAAERIANQIAQISKLEAAERYNEIGIILLIIGYAEGDRYYAHITHYLKSEQHVLKNNAIKAAGLTAEPHFILELLALAGNKVYRPTAVKALKSYGPQIMKTLEKELIKENLPPNQQKFIPRVLESFKSQDAVRILLRLARSKNLQTRYEAIKSIYKLHKKAPALSLPAQKINALIRREATYYKNSIRGVAFLKSIIEEEVNEEMTNTAFKDAELKLLELLKVQRHINLKLLFRLMSFIYEKADIEVAYNGLFAQHSEARINAIEFLDNMLQLKLKTSILPLIEFHLADDPQTHADHLQLKKLSERQLLKMLITNRGKEIKLACIYYIKTRSNPQYLRLVKELCKHHNTEVSQAAIDAVETLRFNSLAKSS